MDDQQKNMNLTINKTLLTAKLMDGFWDRWLVHGVNKSDLETIRFTFIDQSNWIAGWESLAEEKILEAATHKKEGKVRQAEQLYRTGGLYYQLIQWIIPEGKNKKYWLKKSVDIFKEADELSPILTRYENLPFDEGNLLGRVRVPVDPKGVVIMINPIDSTKEELYKYEIDFVNGQFITINFDGPGQGETFTFEDVKATGMNWGKYVHFLIEYSSAQFPNLPITLFGTSSGASWSIYGSCHPRVSKAVAVSPAFIQEEIRLPDYFVERMRYVIKNNERVLPSFNTLSFRNPVFLVHGNRDVMVSDKNIYALYDQLPFGKCLVEYQEEGHCCNYKLDEIRKSAMNWFQEEKREKR